MSWSHGEQQWVRERGFSVSRTSAGHWWQEIRGEEEREWVRERCPAILCPLSFWWWRWNLLAHHLQGYTTYLTLLIWRVWKWRLWFNFSNITVHCLCHLTTVQPVIYATQKFVFWPKKAIIYKFYLCVALHGVYGVWLSYHRYKLRKLYYFVQFQFYSHNRINIMLA